MILSRQKIKGTLLPSFVVIAVLIAVRMLNPNYSQLAFLLLFYIALGSAFNIFMGLTGYVCFGYSAFLALGSYGMALAVQAIYATPLTAHQVDLPVLVLAGLTMGALLSSLLALVVGGIALRLREVYFGIATIGLNRAIRFFIEGTKIWGGSEGIIISGYIIRSLGRESLAFISIELADYLISATTIITVFIAFIIIHSKMGYALLAIREDEDTASVMGVNTTFYKVVAFVISAALAGVLGSIKVLKDQAVFPAESFALIYSIESILITLIGGRGTTLGPVVGGAIYGLLKYYLSAYFPGLQLLILAPLMIVIIMMFPYGIIGWIRLKFKFIREYIS